MAIEKKDKKVAEAPDGMEYIWVRDRALETKHNPFAGFIRPNKTGATDYLFDGLKMTRTGKLHTHEGRRCIFADMPVFEVEK